MEDGYEDSQLLVLDLVQKVNLRFGENDVVCINGMDYGRISIEVTIV